MSLSKKSQLKRLETKPSKGSPDSYRGLDGCTLEYDSCYRGKIEIWKDGNGEVVSQKIIR